MNENKYLVIPFASSLDYKGPMQKLSFQLDYFERSSLDNAPWPAYAYKPKVQFTILYNDECIFLKYFVEESSIRARETDINGRVWEDSCVEFFVAFDNSGYYNLEFNCIGTARVGFGKSRFDRHLLPAATIQNIRCYSTLERSENVSWELTICIPITTFVFHEGLQLQGKEGKANFYKCGDALPEPHFITWSNIDAPEPDFHQSQFFGRILFKEENKVMRADSTSDVNSI